MKTQYIFSEEPARLVALRNGTTRCIYNVVESTEPDPIPEDAGEGFVPTSHPIWICDVVFVSTPEEYGQEGIPAASYDELVSAIIRTAYSVDAELAILRQREEKPEDFTAYNAWAEKAKSTARELLGIA